MATTQDGRFLQIDTPLGKDVLLITGFRANEAISNPFMIQVDAICELPKSDTVDSALIGKNAVITVTLKDGAKRYFHGMINRLVSGGRGFEERYVRFQLEIVPTLARLLLRSNCRVFQNVSVADIVKEVLKAENVEVRDALTKTYTPRDYCVQYRETDLNFISRLMEDEGIFYFFEHKQDKHTMVLADGPPGSQPCPVQSSVHYEEEGGYGEREDTVGDWTVTEQLRSGAVSLTDYHFQMANKFCLQAFEVTKFARAKSPIHNPSLQVLDYPGDYAKPFNDPDKRLGKVEEEGHKLVRLRAEGEEAAFEEANGTSNVRAFCSGFRFTLKDHFRETSNTDWLLTSVQHSAVQSPDYVSGETAGHAYSNRFTCIPYEVPFVPERVTPKPRTRGPQTAVVVGPDGEDIWPDKFGRVKVQFFWAAIDADDGSRSCWVRVAQPWAGKNWGFVSIPRIGHEVVVDFLEGDPDQPIIVGSVYNSDNMPPYALPDNKTRTGIKTRSSKGGGPSNFSEIRFEDKKGSEDLYVHAEKTLTGIVEADETRAVGGSRTTKIHKDETETVETGDHTLTVSKGNRMATISEGNDNLFVVKGSLVHSVNSGYMVTADTIQIAAKSTIQLICGGSSIIMTPEVIMIQGTLVKIN